MLTTVSLVYVLSTPVLEDWVAHSPSSQAAHWRMQVFLNRATTLGLEYDKLAERDREVFKRLAALSRISERERAPEMAVLQREWQAICERSDELADYARRYHPSYPGWLWQTLPVER